MKLLLNIILVLFTFFACYIEEIYLFLLPPQPQETIPLTIRSQRYFNFDQEKALGGKREIALSQYVPLYTDVPGRTEKVNTEIAAPVTGTIISIEKEEEAGLSVSRSLINKAMGN